MKELYVSVDVETAGPIPGVYSLLSIGACTVADISNGFYRELKPTSEEFDPAAIGVTGFSLAKLRETGVEPDVAMRDFNQWVTGLKEDGATVVFVGLNAPFDWSFINYYFHKYLGKNPFGFTALDIKAYYMGATGVSWEETKSSMMAKELEPRRKGNHNALADAQYQAEIFNLIRTRLK